MSDVQSSSWVPLLSGPLAERAQRAVEDVLCSLAQDGRTGGPLTDAPGLGGATGVALLFGYAALTRPELRLSGQVQAQAHLTHAMGAVASTPLGASLYAGFPGIAWAVEHLERVAGGGAGGEEDANGDVDAALLEHVAGAAWRGQYDLISGLAGLAVYALERLPRPGGAALLGHVVQRLEERAEHRPEGVTWWTAPELLPDWQARLNPRGYYNLGIAHGVPGVMAVLAQAASAGVLPDRAATLARGAARWLLTYRAGERVRGQFPSWVTDGEELKPSRDAWCYGDPGVAVALVLAGRALGEPTWESAGLELARGAARRTMEETKVRDAGLCHGAAGLAHLFNRLFQATGDALLREAAVAWFTRALDMRRPGEGFGGFLSYRYEPDGTHSWRAEPNLLTGSAGIALALLAATGTVEPTWDRLLLANVPLRRQVGSHV